MKKLLVIVTAILMTITSQASTSPNGTEYRKLNTVSATRPKTVTPNVQGRVKHKKVVKAKTQRAVPFGMDDNDDDFAQAEDLQTGYRRRDLNKIEHVDDISEKVRWRLFLARQLAMLKHREVHG